MIPKNEILILNPRRKKRRTPKAATRKRTTRTRTTVARKRIIKTKRPARRRVVNTKGRVTMPRKKARKRARPRRNPSRRRKAVTRRARGAIAGLNFRGALRNIPLGVIGMFVTKWAAKRGGLDALESDPATWNGMTYLKGGLGAAGAGWAANMIKPGTGQRVLEGGLMLLLYKAAQNHLIPKNSFLTQQFGQNEYDDGGYDQGEGEYYPGQVEVNEEGEPFILGQDGQTWIPLDEGEYSPELADALETPGRLGFGDALETPGRLGFGQPATQSAYARSLFQQ